MSSRRRHERIDWGSLTGHPAPPRSSPEAAGLNGSVHPNGAIRLGVDVASGRPFDLAPSELGQHVFLPGASGSGKTTTIIRLVAGVLRNGYAVVVIDAKGGGLAGPARRLAERHGVPFQLVDPEDEASLGYDVCSGSPGDITNKLIGAFEYGANAEVYKHTAMEALPLIASALQAAGERVTLRDLYAAFGKGGMTNIGRRSGEPFASELRALEQAGGVGAAGYNGLQRRLGALMRGTFGTLLTTESALDWNAVLAAPSVTHVSLSATAAGEDVELMGRVLIQDLKQVCGRRIRTDASGAPLVPTLVVLDEFAALREAPQVVDLLLQARQARMPCVVSTQYLPEAVPVRKAALGAGLLVVHRVDGEEAELLAGQWGTRPSTELTNQVDYETGYSAKGSLRRTERYVMHPNELRRLVPGRAAVRSIVGERHAIVQVHREPL